MSSIDQREEARYRQDVLGSYRAWLAYLEAQQALLAASGEAQAGSDPFEGLSRAAEQAEEARRRIAALPADRRELFDAIYESDRQQTQRTLDAEAQVRGGTLKRADPDEVARRALTRLLEEARGLHRDDRRGMVPRGKPDAIKWLALDLSDIAQAPPSETDYQLAEGRRSARRGLILNGVFAALAILAIPALLFLLQRPGSPSAASGAPSAGGVTLTPWPILAVDAGDDQELLRVHVTQTRWPDLCAEAAPPHACWQEGSFHPVQLCLPAELLPDRTTLSLVAEAGLPTRVFTLDATGASDADLVVSACEEDDAAPAPRFGRLRGVEPLPDLAPGEPAPGQFAVTAIIARGRGEDPTIPEGRMVLSVTVADADAQRDWVALAPTVLLADGSRANPSETHADGAIRRFDYLVAEQLDPFDVLWQVAGANHAVRYRATLEPPPARDTVLRAHLRVDNLAVTPAQQTMTVRLTLHNTALVPLLVSQADLGFQTTATYREVAAPMLRQPLAPDERRTVVLDLPLENGTLEIGPHRYELSVRR